jgi:hypothetical protein
MCECIADNTYLCEDGQKRFDTGSAAATANVIAAQDRARAAKGGTLKAWAPWVAGALLVGGAVWWIRR